MATAEFGGFSPEQHQAYNRIVGFFGKAESDFPAAAGQLVNVVGGLVGEQLTTQRKLQEGMGNIDVGLALIGDWLKEAGADGFEVKLGLGGGTKKAIGRKLMPFPNAPDLIRVESRGNPRSQEQIQSLLSSFSLQVRGALDVGLSPRQIVGGLVAESVGSRLSTNGSETLRSALEEPLAGHFEWIREALGIPDVTTTQLEFREKIVQPAGKEERVGRQPTTRPVEKASPAERELPAFLGGYKLPEGYQWVDFPNGSEQLIALGEREGSTVACYIQGFGVRLTRGPGDITYFQFLGISLPGNIAPTQRGIPLSESEERPLFVQAGDSREKSIQLRRTDWTDFLTFPFQTVIRYGSKDFTISDFGSLGISFRMRPTENSRGNIEIRNENINYGSIDRIAIPSTAIVKAVGAAAEARRRTAEKLARPEKAVEVVLTTDETVLMLALAEMAEIERDQIRPPDVAELQTLFVRTQGDFSRLPPDSRMRAKVMKNVIGQLGAEGEKLRKSGKTDREIFDEWLKQVFLALYRRARKKP